MQVFLDESGYTGQHLLDPKQPAFTIATIGFNESECADLKARHFGSVQAAELKYKSLARRPRQQQMVLSFLREIVQQPRMVKVSLAHKEFVVVTKMVDHLTENHAHLAGLNLYKDGTHLALANMLYVGLPAICGREYFDRLLQSFQASMLDRNHDSFTEFRRVLFAEHLTDEQREWLAYFQAPVLELGYRLFEEIDAEPFELAVTFGKYLMGIWRSENRDIPIELIHDRSSNIAGMKHVWDFFMSKDREPFERNRPWGGTTVYPIGLDSTTFADSKDWVGLQLADVVAGAFADGARWAIREGGSEDAYADELWHTVIQESDVLANPVWPDPEMYKRADKWKGTDLTEELDYSVNEMARERLDPKRRRGSPD